MPAPSGSSSSMWGSSNTQQRDGSTPAVLGIGSNVRIVKGVHTGKDGVVRRMMGNKLSVQVNS
jgi:hypothetical protein